MWQDEQDKSVESTDKLAEELLLPAKEDNHQPRGDRRFYSLTGKCNSDANLQEKGKQERLQHIQRRLAT